MGDPIQLFLPNHTKAFLDERPHTGSWVFSAEFEDDGKSEPAWLSFERPSVGGRGPTFEQVMEALGLERRGVAWYKIRPPFDLVMLDQSETVNNLRTLLSPEPSEGMVPCESCGGSGVVEGPWVPKPGDLVQPIAWDLSEVWSLVVVALGEDFIGTRDTNNGARRAFSYDGVMPDPRTLGEIGCGWAAWAIEHRRELGIPEELWGDLGDDQ